MRPVAPLFLLVAAIAFVGCAGGGGVSSPADGGGAADVGARAGLRAG